MGAQESTQRLTIPNENLNTIQLTPAAASKLKKSISNQSSEANDEQEPSIRGTQSNVVYAAPMESLTLRKLHEQEMKRVEESWKNRLASYEKQNNELSKTTTERLASDLTSIEEKYTKRQRYDPVCPDVEKKVEECLKGNTAMSLKCSQEVKEFVGCIENVKQKVLSSKTLLQ